MPRRPGLRLLATALATAAVLAAGPVVAQDESLPRLSGRVVDEAEVLSPEIEAQLIDLLAGHETATGNQVVVVTLSSLRGHDIAEFGVRLAHAWGLDPAGRGKGVLLIVAPQDRAVRIEVGDSLEARLSEDAAHLIIEREVLPAVRSGDLESGVMQGTRAVLASLAGGYLPPPEPETGISDETLGAVVAFAIAGVYLLLVGYATLRARGRRGDDAMSPGASGNSLAPSGAPHRASGRW